MELESLEHTAIEQNSLATYVDQMSRAGHAVGSAEKANLHRFILGY
jgi:hypothetical protein